VKTDLERDLRDMMHRTAEGLQHAPAATPGLIRRARLRRAGTALLAGVAVLALVVGGFAATRSLLNNQAIPPADPRPEGIFADVHGWIAYGNEDGIWAVDPERPGDPAAQIRLSSNQGTPKAWSPDGSKLLFLREPDLFILNADGTETRLTDAHGEVMTGGSFSPDGTEVVYARSYPWKSSAIYIVDADGGAPELVLASRRRWIRDGGCPQYEGCSHGGRIFHTYFHTPVFSPDGTQIAYFDGMGDWGNTLRVMNADGSGVRVVIDQQFGHVDHLVWSRDGSRLAFSALYDGGLWIAAVDGSGLTKLLSEEWPIRNVAWSPDGSRISYQRTAPRDGSSLLPLEIVTLDGGSVQEFGYAGSGPWNPLDR
jgi:Tol biopolymer transport system component